MKVFHGRAAYCVGKSIVVVDGGSVIGKLIFEYTSVWRGKSKE